MSAGESLFRSASAGILDAAQSFRRYPTSKMRARALLERPLRSQGPLAELTCLRQERMVKNKRLANRGACFLPSTLPDDI